MASAAEFIVHGLTVSYFTRKVTGYLDYKGLPWRLRPSIGINLAARQAGFSGLANHVAARHLDAVVGVAPSSHSRRSVIAS